MVRAVSQQEERVVAHRRWVVGFFAWVLLASVFSYAAHAVADDVALLLSRTSASVALTGRDPQVLLASLDQPLPLPVVVRTKCDAVARELARSIVAASERELGDAAQALCDEAQRLGYDPLMFLALVRVESGFDPGAISPRGALGLMQLMPETAAWMAKKLDLPWEDASAFDPALNVRLGTRYLGMLRRQMGRWDLALTAYNRGPAMTRMIVQREGELPAHVRASYSDKVLAEYARLRSRYGALPAG